MQKPETKKEKTTYTLEKKQAREIACESKQI